MNELLRQMRLGAIIDAIVEEEQDKQLSVPVLEYLEVVFNKMREKCKEEKNRQLGIEN